MLCIGHRGAAGYEPENTLISFRKALELGADWIELDVHPVGGELVIIHDETLDRTTSGEGDVRDQDLGYLLTLDAGKGQTIPTLAQVFDLVDRRAGIHVELKDADAVLPVADLVERYIRERGWSYERIIVSSINHEELRLIKRINPRILTGALLSGEAPASALFAEELRAYSIHPSLATVTRALVNDAHARGIRVFVFTVNEPRDIMRMESLGVDGVFTDYPDRVRQRP